MPMLENHKHELFAQGLAGGKSASEAYEQAGYAPSRAAACRLSTKVNVKARVAELQSRIENGIVISRQRVLEELGTIAFAVADEKVRTADKRAALMDIAKLEGWVIELSERGKPGDFSRMSEDELRDFVTREAAELGLGSKRATGSLRTPGLRSKPH